ncbi:patatin-like phospholipase family protein [Aquiflexum gelatinilyticum]|uniref:Patatin-like phospholipase family protein n=1 Tax=Aquiflexum gelatinilyticum TaxID=2961943 RepID=A0A9X2P494_9BACT|nr:patatin-like phospholipase family protein [Aquiflexum gelatinilyticum]MCR9015686.1 patatin-like phospholipase family protein [Aquiflexum gelatinilyticum]
MTDPKPPTQNPKKSLVLAGGGMRVAYQAGVLVALEEEGISFDHVDGTSGGIFNTGMLASGWKPKEIAEKWRTLKLSGFMSAGSAKSYLKPFKTQGIADANNIRKKVFPHLGISVSQINKQEKFAATFNVCNFSTKSVEAIPSNSVTEDHLIAGVSLPIFMPAIQIQDTWYTDAVWIKDANLMEAVKQGSKELWLVWAIGNSPTYLGGAFNQYVHMIEMSANGALLEEYNQIKLTNEIGAIGKSEFEPIKLFVIKPPIALPLDPDFFFNKVNAKELINMGYAHAKKYLSSIPPKGEFLEADTTKNREPEFLYSFRVSFSGKSKSPTKSQKMEYSLYFRFAEFREHHELEVYSSLKLEDIHDEISCFDHLTEITNTTKGRKLEIQTSLILEGKVHKITVATVLTNPLEILMGLNFKDLTFKMWDENANLITETILYQSILDRLKAVYFSSLKSTLDKSIGIRKRFSTLKNLINYGI